MTVGPIDEAVGKAADDLTARLHDDDDDADALADRVTVATTVSKVSITTVRLCMNLPTILGGGREKDAGG